MKQSMIPFGHGASNKKQRLLCSGKVIQPYHLANTFDKIERIKHIPKQSFFYSQLLEKGCTDEEYAYAKNVWSTLEVENLKHYTKIYNHCDVLSLA